MNIGEAGVRERISFHGFHAKLFARGVFEDLCKGPVQVHSGTQYGEDRHAVPIIIYRVRARERQFRLS